MTKKQLKSFKELLIEMKADLLVHGDCIGADDQAGNVAGSLGMSVNKRPSTLSDDRAFSKVGTVVAEERPPLDRNRDIVDDGDCLIACPRRMKEERRSGTWATVRYAAKIDTPLWLVWPDGSVKSPVEPSRY